MPAPSQIASVLVDAAAGLMVPLSLPPVAPRAEANRDRLPVPAAQPSPIFLKRVRAANKQNFLAGPAASSLGSAPPFHAGNPLNEVEVLQHSTPIMASCQKRRYDKS